MRPWRHGEQGEGYLSSDRGSALYKYVCTLELKSASIPERLAFLMSLTVGLMGTEENNAVSRQASESRADSVTPQQDGTL